MRGGGVLGQDTGGSRCGEGGRLHLVGFGVREREGAWGASSPRQGVQRCPHLVLRPTSWDRCGHWLARLPSLC